MVTAFADRAHGSRGSHRRLQPLRLNILVSASPFSEFT